MKRDWEEFQRGDPGSRFERRYRRRQESGGGWLDPRRFFNVVVGLALVVVSTFFGWAPGPGMLTFFIGLGMVAGEFRPAARFLDWAELKVRALTRWLQATWKSSVAGKVLIVTAATLLVAATAYVAYRFLFAG